MNDWDRLLKYKAICIRAFKKLVPRRSSVTSEAWDFHREHVLDPMDIKDITREDELKYKKIQLLALKKFEEGK
jgi:hypothetical protein